MCLYNISIAKPCYRVFNSVHFDLDLVCASDIPVFLHVWTPSMFDILSSVLLLLYLLSLTCVYVRPRSRDHYSFRTLINRQIIKHVYFKEVKMRRFRVKESLATKSLRASHTNCSSKFNYSSGFSLHYALHSTGDYRLSHASSNGTNTIDAKTTLHWVTYYI